MTLYLGNNTNLLREADLTATNTAPSSAIERTDTAPKLGRGVVSITGPFTGAADKTIDVEILGSEGDTARVSEPVFTGVGNGTMTDVTADVALPAQTVTASLESLGSLTADATAQFQGQQLDAIEVGDDGNLITLVVDRTNVVRAESVYSIPAGGISTGTNEYLGDQWNFGAVTLQNGSFPADPATGFVSSPRISFGDDPQVYRPFRKFVGSGYVYGFSPAPVRDVAAGAKVWIVSGAYQLAITDGTSPETISDLTTLYSALVGIRDHSALVEVDDDSVVIANDLAPGGKGVVDVDVWTNAYITSIVRDGSQQLLDAEITVNADDTAPTEQLTLTAITGAKFRVDGSVSGRLTDLTAGTPYSDGPYDILISEAVVDPGEDDDATIAVHYKPGPEHGDGSLPNISFPGALLGPNARAGTYTFTWRNAPPEPCDEEGTITGGIDYACLGLVGAGGAIVADKPEIVVRIQKVLDSLQARIDSNTEPPETVDDGPVEYVQKRYALYLEALRKMDSESAKLETELAGFAAIPYAKGVVIYVVSTGKRWIVTIPGTATTEPTWGAGAVGDSVMSGPVQFTSLGVGPLGQFDAAFTDMEGDANDLDGIDGPQNYPLWRTGLTVQIGSRVVPSQQQNDKFFEVTELTIDGTNPVGPAILQTGATEPIWPDTDTVDEMVATGNMIEWTAKSFTTDGGGLTLEGNVKDSFFDRDRSKLNSVLYAAGVGANFSFAGPKGDGCWPGDEHKGESRWESGDGFLDFFNGIYNTTSKETTDPDGNPVRNATHEFGFFIKCGCEENLHEGDQIEVIVIGGFTNGGGGYSIGDNFGIPVIHAEPIAFTGGQSGTDSMTWSVIADGVPLADYSVPFTGTPTPYSDGDIGFTITPGWIRFELGDAFSFDIENGQFRYSIDGAAFSAATDIEDTSIGDGLTITFTGGAAPSWIDGDAWSFLAQAINGPDALRQPTAARCRWTGATVITITPGADNDDVSGILLADHEIPSTATIHLKGGTLGFVVPTVDVTVPWRKGSIWQSIDPLTCAEWRVEVSQAASANWIHLGTGTTPFMVNGLPEQGIATKLVQLAGFLKRRAFGARIEHTALAQDSVAEILDMLDHACENDDCRIGLVLNLASSEGGIVSINPDTLQQFGDELGFQPLDIDHSLQSLTLDLAPVA